MRGHHLKDGLESMTSEERTRLNERLAAIPSTRDLGAPETVAVISFGETAEQKAHREQERARIMEGGITDPANEVWVLRKRELAQVIARLVLWHTDADIRAADYLLGILSEFSDLNQDDFLAINYDGFFDFMWGNMSREDGVMAIRRVNRAMPQYIAHMVTV